MVHVLYCLPPYHARDAPLRSRLPNLKLIIEANTPQSLGSHGPHSLLSSPISRTFAITTLARFFNGSTYTCLDTLSFNQISAATVTSLCDLVSMREAAAHKLFLMTLWITMSATLFSVSPDLLSPRSVALSALPSLLVALVLWKVLVSRSLRFQDPLRPPFRSTYILVVTVALSLAHLILFLGLATSRLFSSIPSTGHGTCINNLYPTLFPRYLAFF